MSSCSTTSIWCSCTPSCWWLCVGILLGVGNFFLIKWAPRSTHLKMGTRNFDGKWKWQVWLWHHQLSVALKNMGLAPYTKNALTLMKLKEEPFNFNSYHLQAQWSANIVYFKVSYIECPWHMNLKDIPSCKKLKPPCNNTQNRIITKDI